MSSSVNSPTSLTPSTLLSTSTPQQEQKPAGNQSFETSTISSAAPTLSPQEKEQQEVYNYNQEYRFLRQVVLQLTGKADTSNIRPEMAQRVEVFLKRIASNGTLDDRRKDFLIDFFCVIGEPEEETLINKCISQINAKTKPHSNEVPNLLPKLILELKKAGCQMLYDKLDEALQSNYRGSLSDLLVPFKEIKIGLDLHAGLDRYNDDPYVGLQKLYS
ncbi:MAG: hypothetical protein AB7H48_11525 [Parachlamydiales bacterium]